MPTSKHSTTAMEKPSPWSELAEEVYLAEIANPKQHGSETIAANNTYDASLSSLQQQQTNHNSSSTSAVKDAWAELSDVLVQDAMAAKMETEMQGQQHHPWYDVPEEFTIEIVKDFESQETLSDDFLRLDLDMSMASISEAEEFYEEQVEEQKLGILPTIPADNESMSSSELNNVEPTKQLDVILEQSAPPSPRRKENNRRALLISSAAASAPSLTTTAPVSPLASRQSDHTHNRSLRNLLAVVSPGSRRNFLPKLSQSLSFKSGNSGSRKPRRNSAGRKLVRFNLSLTQVVIIDANEIQDDDNGDQATSNTVGSKLKKPERRKKRSLRDPTTLFNARVRDYDALFRTEERMLKYGRCMSDYYGFICCQGPAVDPQRLREDLQAGLAQGYRGLELWSDAGMHRSRVMNKIIQRIIQAQADWEAECYLDGLNRRDIPSKLAHLSKGLTKRSTAWAIATAEYDAAAAQEEYCCGEMLVVKLLDEKDSDAAARLGDSLRLATTTVPGDSHASLEELSASFSRVLTRI